jgi:hypothetical protein
MLITEKSKLLTSPVSFSVPASLPLPHRPGAYPPPPPPSSSIIKHPSSWSQVCSTDAIFYPKLSSFVPSEHARVYEVQDNGHSRVCLRRNDE